MIPSILLDMYGIDLKIYASSQLYYGNIEKEES